MSGECPAALVEYARYGHAKRDLINAGCPGRHTVDALNYSIGASSGYEQRLYKAGIPNWVLSAYRVFLIHASTYRRQGVRLFNSKL